ncbi:hypothetical protein ABZZ74_20500 [Streptomyces sp. NPDC006476]|uniref:hypothetical protein n=1 Tax=Streptomyces sp. NPDC006476 TaxID=3157175 RepID=UPI0033B38DDA
MAGRAIPGHGLAFDVEMDTRAAQIQQLHASPTTRVLMVNGAAWPHPLRRPGISPSG